MEVNYLDKYHITSDARLYRKHNDLWVECKQSIAGSGYMNVNIHSKRTPLHRIVALVFIDNPEGKPFVNHIDGNKLNNNAENLEWCTHSENMIHAYKNGLIPSKVGELNGMFGMNGQLNPIAKKQIEYETTPCKRGSWNDVAKIGSGFKRTCANNGWIFDDFIEIKSNEKLKYYYIHKERYKK